MAEQKKSFRGAKRGEGDAEPPLLEWICGGIGAVLFSAVIAILLREGLDGPMPPDVSGRVVAIEQREPGWLVLVSVRNTGDAARDVKLEVTSGAETREMTLEFLATEAEATGAVLFKRQPVPGQIRIEMTGFLAP